MKKLTSVFLVLIVLLLASCGPTSNQQPTAMPTTAVEVESTATKAVAAPVEDCSTMPLPTLAEGILKPTTKTGPLTIAYVPNVMNTHYEMVLNGIKEQIELFGGDQFATLQLQVPTSNTTSIQEQADILETLVTQGVDAILLATESEEAEMPYMKAATEAGIPVFLFNMAELRPDDPYYVTMVGYDQKNAGYLIGEWAVNHFGDTPTKAAILEGFPGLVNSMRLDGFNCAIAGHDNIEVVTSQVADWTRAKGQEVTENILTANPDINFLFGLYDEMSLGAITAIKERGLISQIAVAGYDNTKDANASIKAGEMMVTVDTAAKEMGINLIKAVKAFVVDGKTIDRIINSELIVYDQSNIDTFNEENYIYVPRISGEVAAPVEDCSTMPLPTLAEGILKPTTKTGPLTIAYVPNVMNTHYEMVLNGIKEQIELFGGDQFATLQLQVPTSNTTSIQEQADILETLVTQGVDAILLATESEEAEMPYMKAATEAGIPVFLFNMAELRPDDPYYVTMVGYDQKNAGYLIGEWAVNHFGDTPTKAAILEGFPGLVNSMRLDGFNCAIAGHDNIEVVTSQVADWTRAKGQEVTENILTANPDINFLFGLYDEMSLGAITAIKERGLISQIAVAGYDNTKDANASIKAGEMMVTVDTAAKEMGINLIKAVKAFVVDGKTIDRIINSALIVYDQSNIDTFNEENYIYVPRTPEK